MRGNIVFIYKIRTQVMKLYKELDVFYTDLMELEISFYIESTHFSRLCITHEFLDIWEIYFDEALSYEKDDFIPISVTNNNALYLFFKDYIKKDFDKFQFYVMIILVDFIENSNSEINLNNVIKDLKLLKFNPIQLEFIEITYLNHRKEKSLINKENLSKKDEVKLPNPSFGTKKKDWKKSISKSDIQKVVDDIIEFGVDNENDIIALSSRWNSLQNKYHKGIMKDDDFGIENNKIVHALLDFIKNMKNTEGV
jgi:Effector-associated domain 11